MLAAHADEQLIVCGRAGHDNPTRAAERTRMSYAVRTARYVKKGSR
jgi:hypothetical protein